MAQQKKALIRTDISNTHRWYWKEDVILEIAFMAYDMRYLSRRDICSAMRSMRPGLRWINEADVNVFRMRLSPGDVDDAHGRTRVLFSSQHHGALLTRAMLHTFQQLRKGHDNLGKWQGQGAGGPNTGLRSVEEFQSIEQTEHQDNLRRLSLIGFPEVPRTQSRQLGANPPHLIAGGAYNQRGSYTSAFTSRNKMLWWFRYYGCENPGSLASMLGPVVVPWYAEMAISSMRKTNF